MIPEISKNRNNRKVSVLIVTYNNSATIAGCLDSLKNQSFQDMEILIRDNASSDETANILESLHANLFKGERNIGFGAAMNFLARQASGEYLFMLNPDCLCPADTLANLLHFAGSHTGVISPSFMFPDGNFQATARNFPDYSNIIFSRRSPLYQLGLVGARDAGYLRSSHALKVQAVSATALWLSRDLFSAIGGFDERFFMYGEDLDLCKRLEENGHDIWHLPDIKIEHVQGASSSQAAIRSMFYHHLSIYKYFTKHFPRKYIRNSILMVLLVAGFAVSLILKILGLSKRK